MTKLPAVSKSPPTPASVSMADVFTKAKRSAVMALIRSRGTARRNSASSR